LKDTTVEVSSIFEWNIYLIRNYWSIIPESNLDTHLRPNVSRALAEPQKD